MARLIIHPLDSRAQRRGVVGVDQGTAVAPLRAQAHVAKFAFGFMAEVIK